MKRSLAIIVSFAAAQAVYCHLRKGLGIWLHDLGDLSIEELSHFLESHPEATTEAFYNYGSGRLVRRRPWNSNEALAAAVETFRCTFEKMLSRVERDAARASELSRDKRDAALTGDREPRRRLRRSPQRSRK